MARDFSMTPILDRLSTMSWFDCLLAWQSVAGESMVHSSSPPTLVAFGLLEFIAISLLATILVVPIVLMAAARLREFQSRGLAIAGSVLIMMPISLIALAGVPVGIWSLTVLMRDDVRKAFAQKTVPVAATRSQLRRAGTWLLVSGFLGILSFVLMALAGLISVMDRPPPSAYYLQMVLTIVAIVGVPFLLSIMQIFTAWKLLNQSSWRWSYVAAILALIPASPAWLVGLPSGIYALAVLGQQTDGAKHNSELFGTGKSAWVA
jgi:hypothetical protein